MESIQNRRSIRKYKDTPVSGELVRVLLESANQAPSGNNTQPWHFILVDDKGMREKLAEVSHRQKWMLSAPLYIVCVADVRVRIPEGADIRLHEESPEFALKQIIRDTAIAVEHMVLEAVHHGLGTCWVAWFTQDEIRPVLGIPEDKYVLGLLTVGYPDESPGPRPRKPLQEKIHRNRW